MRLLKISLSMLAINLASQAYASVFPRVVDELDLSRYAGLWYEVASTKPVFQRDCVCVTAEYTALPDGNIEVRNTCRKNEPTAPLEEVIGVAKPTRTPAKFNVSFGGFSLPFSNYWVVDLAEDYSFAVVSTPIKRPIWILSRTPSLDPSTLHDILGRLKEQGFPTSALRPTLQETCPAA